MNEVQKEVKEATAISEEAQTLGQRLGRWIDDPFASVIVGLVMPAIASTFVLSGILALGVVN